RIVGADAHVVAEVLSCLAALAHHVDDHALAHGLLAGRAAEGVLHLSPVLAVAAPEAARADGAHLLAMHELMVHVEEVLVHERVVAGHLAVEPPGLVVAALRGAERPGRYARLRQRRIARKDEDEAVDLPDRVAADAVRYPLPAEVGHIHALAAAVVRPAVVVALHAVPLNHPEMQRDLPVRTAVLQREHPSARAAVERDRICPEPTPHDLSGPHLIRPRQRIPIIGIRGRAPQVQAGCRDCRQRGGQNRMVVRHRPCPQLLSEDRKITPDRARALSGRHRSALWPHRGGGSPARPPWYRSGTAAARLLPPEGCPAAKPHDAPRAAPPASAASRCGSAP